MRELDINLVHTVLQYPTVNFFEISTNARAASGSLEQILWCYIAKMLFLALQTSKIMLHQ